MSIPIDNSTTSLGNWSATTSSEQLWNIWNATGGLNLPIYTEVLFANYNGATPPKPGLITLLNGAEVVAVIVITFDGSNNVTSILRTS
jgi:hypothetical protein